MKTKKLKIQKRSIEVIEYENGTYKVIGSAWNLDNLNSEDIDEAFNAWRTGELKEECSMKIKPPKTFKN